MSVFNQRLRHNKRAKSDKVDKNENLNNGISVEKIPCKISTAPTPTDTHKQNRKARALATMKRRSKRLEQTRQPWKVALNDLAVAFGYHLPELQERPWYTKRLQRLFARQCWHADARQIGI